MQDVSASLVERAKSLAIEVVPASELQRFEHNTKTHPQKQIDALKASITRFGFNDPIGVWRGVIVEGHGRLTAAMQLGLDEVPVIRLPDDMTEADIAMYRIAHNKIALNTSFDFGMLVEELAVLCRSVPVTDMGFSNEHAAALFRAAGEDLPSEIAMHVEEERQALADNGATFDADVIWDDAEQKGRWEAMMKPLRQRFSGESDGAIITRVVTGVLNGTIQPKQPVANNASPEELSWT